MKYFRDPRVFLLTLLCLIVFAVLISAVRIGQTHDDTPPAAALNRGAALNDVDALRSHLIELPRLVAQPGNELRPWATQLAALATQAAEHRKLQGAAANDGLVRTLQQLAADATELAEADPAKPLEIRSAAGKVYTDADMLPAILGGAAPQLMLPESTPTAAPGASSTPSGIPSGPPVSSGPAASNSGTRHTGEHS